MTSITHSRKHQLDVTGPAREVRTSHHENTERTFMQTSTVGMLASNAPWVRRSASPAFLALQERCSLPREKSSQWSYLAMMTTHHNKSSKARYPRRYKSQLQPNWTWNLLIKRKCMPDCKSSLLPLRSWCGYEVMVWLWGHGGRNFPLLPLTLSPKPE